MSDDAASGADRRRARRAAVKLRGRFLAADGREHPCETVDVSVTGVALHAYMTPTIGERLVIYLDELGRLEGVVTSQRREGFVVELMVQLTRAAKLAQKLSALADKADDFALRDDAAARSRKAELRVEFGQTYQVNVVDETFIGARIAAHFSLLPGVRVFIDGRPAMVTHDSGAGFQVRFER